MGAAGLPRIAAELVGHGRSPGTPVALIRWGTTEAQELSVSTLGAVATHARAAGVAPPMLAIIGEVVRLRERLAWFDARARRTPGLSSAPRVAATRQNLTRRPGGA
jgi:siroheme synthase